MTEGRARAGPVNAGHPSRAGKGANPPSLKEISGGIMVDSLSSSRHLGAAGALGANEFRIGLLDG